MRGGKSGPLFFFHNAQLGKTGRRDTLAADFLKFGEKAEETLQLVKSIVYYTIFHAAADNETQGLCFWLCTGGVGLQKNIKRPRELIY